VKKPRADSRLKTLPQERRREIFELCQHTPLKEVVVQLKAQGVATSITALSEFWSWYQLYSQHQQMEEDTKTLVDFLKVQGLKLTDAELDAYGQKVFSTMALRAANAKEWIAIRKLAIESQSLEHDRRRIELLEQAAARAQTASDVVAGPLSPEEKQRKLREIFGLPS
jgi:hypothetical protein